VGAGEAGERTVTPPEPLSSLLERAAAELERRAADFGPMKYWELEVRGADLSLAGAAWAKLMGPLVAAPLAALLRSDAARISWAETWDQVDRSYAGGRLAAFILGEPAPGEAATS
jgi:hypothetical protein